MDSNTLRPEFNGPDEFVKYLSTCLYSGTEPFPPNTVDELLAALELWPEFSRRWLPSPDDCRRLGIDPEIGRPVELLTEREQERWLVTLRDDEDFLLAMRSLILGGTPA